VGDRDAELERLVEEQSALRRVATLVAAGAGEVELVNGVTSEIAGLFDAHRANTMRWDGDTIHVIGDWSQEGEARHVGRAYAFGGDTITARVVNSRAPARVDSPDDIRTDFGRARWAELGLYSSIGAPVIVDGRLWGVVTASRTTPEPFPPEAEHRLGDFAALVAQAIVNSEARRELAALAEEQAALRRVATLVAGAKPQAEVLDAVTREAATVFGAQAVSVVRWEGVQDEVFVVAACGNGHDDDAIGAGSLYHPAPGSATLRTLETGLPQRTDEHSPELGERHAIAAPVIVNAELVGAITALRPGDEAFAAGAEIRLRSFADLAAQSIANTRAQDEMQASRARIVQAADDARERLERNLHDGAQQRLVAVSIQLRIASGKLTTSPEEARALLASASEELTHAIDDLRELARGIHPAVLTDRGLGPALEALAARAPLRVDVENDLGERLPAPVEAAAYYVVAESLTNAAKYAQASGVAVRVSRQNGVARIEVADDGVGGADSSRGSGLRGLADRVEALSGRLGVDSEPRAGTCVWAEIPVA
jgi:signal transduction histidine kinase